MTGPQPKATERKAKAIELRRSGLRNVDIAKQLGLTNCRVWALLKDCGIPAPRKIPPVTAEKAERVRVMIAAYKKGKTLQQIGDIFGVTRERIRQVLRKAGVDGDLGGSRLRLFLRQAEAHRKVAERKAAHIAKIETYFGCCHAEIARICGKEFASAPYVWMAKDRKSPGGAYMNQRRNAKKRGIVWNLSLTDWWRIWQESGHWEQRGRGKGYCMARRGDDGPYSVENVYICTVGQNFADSYLIHPWHERFPDVHKRDPLELTELEASVISLRRSGLSRRRIAEELERPVGTINWALHSAARKGNQYDLRKAA